MAGILANSVSVSHTSSTADDTNAGYLNQERITLTTLPTGTTYQWAMSKPVASGAVAKLSSDSAASVSFIPDVAGYYVITCTVDSTTFYVLRISVTDTVAATAREALRLQPKADAQIATPSSGVALYYSSTQDALAIKDSSGNVHTVDITAV